MTVSALGAMQHGGFPPPALENALGRGWCSPEAGTACIASTLAMEGGLDYDLEGAPMSLC